jgi:hypothetical protein
VHKSRYTGQDTRCDADLLGLIAAVISLEGMEIVSFAYDRNADTVGRDAQGRSRV